MPTKNYGFQYKEGTEARDVISSFSSCVKEDISFKYIPGQESKTIVNKLLNQKAPNETAFMKGAVDSLRRAQMKYVLNKCQEASGSKEDLKKFDTMKYKEFSEQFDEALKAVSKKEDGSTLTEAEIAEFMKQATELDNLDVKINKEVDENLTNFYKEGYSIDKFDEAAETEAMKEKIATSLGFSQKEVKEYREMFGKGLNVTKEGNLELINGKFQEIYKQAIDERMNALPENERTEEAFLRECSKMDTLVRTNVFMNYPGVTLTKDADLAVMGYINKDEFKKWGSTYNNAKGNIEKADVDSKKILAEYPNPKSNYEKESLATKMGSVIKLLQDQRGKRGFFSRIGDRFRSDGEYAKIQEIISALKEKGVTDDMIKDGIKNADVKETSSLNNFIEKEFDDRRKDGITMSYDEKKDLYKNVEEVQISNSKDSVISDEKQEEFQNQLGDDLAKDDNIVIGEKVDESKLENALENNPSINDNIEEKNGDNGPVNEEDNYHVLN